MNESKTSKKGSYTVAKAFIELAMLIRTNLSNVFLLCTTKIKQKASIQRSATHWLDLDLDRVTRHRGLTRVKNLASCTRKVIFA